MTLTLKERIKAAGLFKTYEVRVNTLNPHGYVDEKDALEMWSIINAQKKIIEEASRLAEEQCSSCDGLGTKIWNGKSATCGGCKGYGLIDNIEKIRELLTEALS